MSPVRDRLPNPVRNRRHRLRLISNGTKAAIGHLRCPVSNGVKILVVTGQSAGHIFPALSFLDNLKREHREAEALLVMSSPNLEISIPAAKYKVKYLTFTTPRLGLHPRNLIALFNLLKGALKSLFLLLEFRPALVVGFGGLGSVPLVLFAWLFRLKTLIHEQNVIPGRANRLLARFVDRVAISFPETKAHLSISQNRIVVTGNPVRQQLQKVDRFKALNFFGFSPDKFTILVMGGTLGSHRINMSFLKAVSTMPYISRLQVIHLTGLKDYGLLAARYSQLNLQLKLFAFLKEMQYAYSVCDLVVARGGATTIAELIKFHLPAIIIPYPFAYQHQMYNAHSLKGMGAATVIKDEELDTDRLRECLDELINTPERLRFMREHYNAIKVPDADNLLVYAVVSLGA